ncbi:alpha/beta fold hydrolase [Caenimonas koreensis DSM 17982]|uniref:Alpha/beta fold hydrolase n=1 Tax=Caenimonas koreensis DSM 17982 TaxID=1121255 RepID=A0A844AQZ4_9BURK|nr:alpha/beta hydrolase [Caenimonas koreensis]MRD46625.1 alpha/beta fold hydrolase [Caenimonas koreensis DSM 17982]
MTKLVRRFLFVLLLLVALVLAGIAASWAPDKPAAELAAKWATPPSQFIELQGMQVHLRDEGPRDDPLPIVLLHGTSASLHTWEGWASALRGNRRVIRVDLPGFALTGPHPKDDYSTAAYVSFVRALADKLNVQRFVLAGNSLGGQIAWSTAAAMPDRVARLILVDASGYPMELLVGQVIPLGFKLAAIPWLQPVVRNSLPRSVVETSVRNVYGDPSKVTPQLVDVYYDMALREGNRRALSLRLAQGYTADTRRLAQLRMPTLILWGGKDKLIPREAAQWFARDIAGSKLVMFDELGHVPHEEDAQRTVQEVVKFLSAPAAGS